MSSLVSTPSSPNQIEQQLLEGHISGSCSICYSAHHCRPPVGPFIEKSTAAFEVMQMPTGQPVRLQGLCVEFRTLLKKTVDVVTAHELQWLLSAVLYGHGVQHPHVDTASYCIQPHLSASQNATTVLYFTHTCTTSRLLWLQAELC
jgi:hypothetical protein